MRTRTGRQVALPVLVLLLATACSDESTSGSLTQVAQDPTVNGAEGDAGVSGTIGSDAVAPSLDASTAPEAGSAEDALVNEGDTVVQDGGPLPDAGGDGTINPDAAPAPDAQGGGACGACGSATPFCFEDTCVACLNSAHCPPGSTCDNAMHECTCDPQTPHRVGGVCVECADDADCPAAGATCAQDTHTCAVVLSQCEDDGDCCQNAPFCVDGQCVGCANDAHCIEPSTCDPNTNFCLGEPVLNCEGPCGGNGGFENGDQCAECLNDAHCGGGTCNGQNQCEPPVWPIRVEATWGVLDGPTNNAVLTLHVVNLAMPVEGPDMDGDGAPDPYFTDASCTVENSPTPWGCEMSMPFGDGHSFGVLEDHPAALYRVAVHYEQHLNPVLPNGEVVDTTALVNVGIEVDEGFPGELHADQPLQPGDLWCVATVDPVASTFEPCLDADGEPLVVPNYPAPEE